MAWWGSDPRLTTAAQTLQIDDPLATRRAGRDLLSLLLLDARNHLLQRLALDDSAPALRLAARAGHYQEQWIACHAQRGRGEGCDAASVRLAGVEPAIEQWLSAAGEDDGIGPTPGRLRGYLAQTLDITLDLLSTTPETGDALHFYRQALLHEDRLGEALDERLRTGMPIARVVRDALWMPAQRWQLGSAQGAPMGAFNGASNGVSNGAFNGVPMGAPRSPPQGLTDADWVPALERWAHEISTPEFEIDAQPVNWAQFVEFVDDGGYDRRDLWTDPGWAWVLATGRRAPAHVEQMRGGVLVQRGHGERAGLQRAAAGQPVMHLTRHEAQAWCQWAGRRLPTEPEWEIAASTASSRGFVWGDVFEWVAGSARLWPGADPAAPGALDGLPGGEISPAHSVGVLRGGSFATRARQRHPKARRFVRTDCDTPFCGFRSCAF